MKAFKLPESITSLVERLKIVQISWHDVPVQIPKFAIYAILPAPIFDKIIIRNGRKIALIRFGRYQIPVLDPFRSDIEPKPNFAVIISHCRDNRFGLYGFPADHIEDEIDMPMYHQSVQRIVKDFV
ncbi:MAG: hypothetical protein ACI88A_003304 [Paraglaciecola sp.]|jgi:hypothetical protein